MKNSINLLGRVGTDVEIRTLNSGGKVASFRLATEESWKDKTSGEWKNRSTWHTVETFMPGTVGYLERNVQKGDLIDVVGMLTYDEYEKDGAKVTRAKIVLRGAGHTAKVLRSSKPNGEGQRAESQTADQYDEGSDIPF